MNTQDGGVTTTAAVDHSDVDSTARALDQLEARATPNAALTSVEGGVPENTISGGTSLTGRDASGQASEEEQRDHAALNLLYDDLEAHLGPAGSSDPVGGTPDYRAMSGRAMDRLLRRIADALEPGTATGAQLGTDALLHKALRLPLTTPLPADAATQILRRVTGLQNPYQIAVLLQQYDSLPEELRTQLFTANPDAEDPLVQATLAALLTPDEAGTSQKDSPSPTPKFIHGALAAVAPVSAVRFGQSLRGAITATRRYFSRSFKNLGPHTDAEGYLAQTIIGMHYVITHPGHPVILDTYAIPASISGIISDATTLATAAANGGVFAAVRVLLLNATGAAARPDILDLTTNEVYEIKPFSQMANGAAQLAMLLLQLNTRVLGSEAAARAFIAALALGGSAPVWFPSDKIQPYVPGTWFPSQIYPLPDGRFMFVVRPIPGVIGYRILGNNRADADGPSLGELSRAWWAMAALAVLGARALLGNEGTGSENTEQHMPPRQVPLNLDVLTKSLLATAGTAGAAGLAIGTVETISTAELVDLAVALLLL